MAAHPVPRRPFGAAARQARRRSTPAVSPVQRRSCLLCVNGWIEGDDNLVSPCPNCRPQVKAQTRRNCQRCGGNGTREFAPGTATTCARCSGTGIEPATAEPVMTPLPWGVAR